MAYVVPEPAVQKENFVYYRTVATTGRWYVYVARCSDGSFYTGITKDVTARIAVHDAGRGARYTRGRGPLTLCAKKRCASKGEALRLELAVKRLSRNEKERLCSVKQFPKLGEKARAHAK